MPLEQQSQLTKDQKVNLLLQRTADETRRLDLDGIDEHARSTHTWGSGEHRQARDRRERAYDAERTAVEKLSSDELDDALAVTPAPKAAD